MPRALAPIVPSLLALALSACASDGEYPSLARRDAERFKGSAEAVEPPLPPPAIAAPPSADLETRLFSLVEQAQAAHERFSATRPRTERLVAAAHGAPVASENWSVATVAIAELESARIDAMVALAELDQLYAAERIENFESESAVAQAISGAADKASALVAEEDRVLAALRGRLPEETNERPPSPAHPLP